MNYDELRRRMVEHQIRGRGIKDPRVIEAMLMTPRHFFVSPEKWEQAYEDHPVELSSGQTISQPYIVALMTELLKLKPGDKVLEVGTGSGYQTAVLAQLAGKVYTIERLPELSKQAQEILAELKFTNIDFFVGDGSLGLQEHAPFDAIIVTAASPVKPVKLIGQLSNDGRLLIPIGDRRQQKLMLFKKEDDQIIEKDCGGCVFVPLVGDEGWPA